MESSDPSSWTDRRKPQIPHLTSLCKWMFFFYHPPCSNKDYVELQEIGCCGEPCFPLPKGKVVYLRWGFWIHNKLEVGWISLSSLHKKYILVLKKNQNKSRQRIYLFCLKLVNTRCSNNLLTIISVCLNSLFLQVMLFMYFFF